jgi:hypothetical protein
MTDFGFVTKETDSQSFKVMVWIELKSGECVFCGLLYHAEVCRISRMDVWIGNSIGKYVFSVIWVQLQTLLMGFLLGRELF